MKDIFIRTECLYPLLFLWLLFCSESSSSLLPHLQLYTRYLCLSSPNKFHIWHVQNCIFSLRLVPSSLFPLKASPSVWVIHARTLDYSSFLPRLHVTENHTTSSQIPLVLLPKHRFNLQLLPLPHSVLHCVSWNCCRTLLTGALALRPNHLQYVPHTAS